MYDAAVTPRALCAELPCAIFERGAGPALKENWDDIFGVDDGEGELALATAGLADVPEPEDAGGSKYSVRSRFRGVTFDRCKGRWRAQIRVASLGKSGVSVGYFDAEEAAARAYDRAALSLLSPDCAMTVLNFDLSDYEGDTVPLLHGKNRDEVKAAFRLEREKSQIRRCSNTKHRTSSCLGVGSTIGKNQWQARILIDGKVTQLGYYPTEAEAARVYDRVSLALHGERAATNFDRAQYAGEDLSALAGLSRAELQKTLGVKPMDKSSRFRGVSRKKAKWEAKVMINRKWVYRELFTLEVEAARAYDEAMRRLKPREARVWCNFAADSAEGATPAVLNSRKLAALPDRRKAEACAAQEGMELAPVLEGKGQGAGFGLDVEEEEEEGVDCEGNVEEEEEGGEGDSAGSSASDASDGDNKAASMRRLCADLRHKVEPRPVAAVRVPQPLLHSPPPSEAISTAMHDKSPFATQQRGGGASLPVSIPGHGGRGGAGGAAVAPSADAAQAQSPPTPTTQLYHGSSGGSAVLAPAGRAPLYSSGSGSKRGFEHAAAPGGLERPAKQQHPEAALADSVAAAAVLAAPPAWSQPRAMAAGSGGSENSTPFMPGMASSAPNAFAPAETQRPNCAYDYAYAAALNALQPLSEAVPQPPLAAMPAPEPPADSPFAVAPTVAASMSAAMAAGSSACAWGATAGRAAVADRLASAGRSFSAAAPCSFLQPRHDHASHAVVDLTPSHGAQRSALPGAAPYGAGDRLARTMSEDLLAYRFACGLETEAAARGVGGGGHAPALPAGTLKQEAAARSNAAAALRQGPGPGLQLVGTSGGGAAATPAMDEPLGAQAWWPGGGGADLRSYRRHWPPARRSAGAQELLRPAPYLPPDPEAWLSMAAPDPFLLGSPPRCPHSALPPLFPASGKREQHAQFILQLQAQVSALEAQFARQQAAAQRDTRSVPARIPGGDGVWGEMDCIDAFLLAQLAARE